MPPSFEPAFAYRFETAALRIPDPAALTPFAGLGDSAAQEFVTGQQIPEVAALGADPGADPGDGEGDDAGGEVSGGEGGETGATPDPEAGAETGAGEPSASTAETPAESSSLSSSTGTPAETTPGQPLQWEQNDPALSPPQSTPAATSGSWVDSTIDYFDAGSVEISGASAVGKPSVGSFLYSMASVTGSALLWVGMAAAVVLSLRQIAIDGGDLDPDDDIGGHDSTPPDAALSAPNQDESAGAIFAAALPDAAVASMPVPTVTSHFAFPLAQGAPLMLPDYRVFLSPAVRELLGLWGADDGSAMFADFPAAPTLPVAMAAGIDLVTTTGVPGAEGLFA